MSGYQFGMSFMSSALARVIESVLPGGVGRILVPSMRGGGRSFSVTGNAHSGLSAAAANVGTSTRARAQTTYFMRPPARIIGACDRMGRLPCSILRRGRTNNRRNRGCPRLEAAGAGSLRCRYGGLAMLDYDRQTTPGGHDETSAPSIP